MNSPSPIPVVCKSTRYGVGCGHSVNDHDGDQSRDCCCCNRLHNEPDHAEECIHCHVRRIKARLGVEKATAGELAEHMPERLRQKWWEFCVGEFVRDFEPIVERMERGED